MKVSGKKVVLVSVIVAGAVAAQLDGPARANTPPPLEATFFVAIDGNDGWSGKLAAPNAGQTDGPFATLKKARDALRELKEEKQSPYTVMVRGGKYFLDETLVLGHQDGGTRESPVTYTAYPDEKPILSGGRKVEGWKPYRGSILQCEVPEAKGGRWRLRQLFFNGQRQTRARFPNFDPDNPIYGGWLQTIGTTPEENQRRHDHLSEEDARRAFKYKPGTFERRWAKPQEAEVFVMSIGGVSNTIPLKKIDKEKSLITMAQAIKGYMRLPYDRNPSILWPGSPFYVQNVLEELDQPGEWCLDSEDGVLYFWPPAPIEGAEVVAPALDCLIDLYAPSWRNTSWITISGFTFTETTSGDNMHREGNEGYGAMSPGAGDGRTYCGEALHMRGAKHCRIENNHFYAVGGNAIYMEDQNGRNLIQNNEISYAGAIGICLVGTKYFYAKRHYPLYNRIANNHIHHCGVFDKYVAGVFLGLCDSNVVAHNLIEHMPHHAINLGNTQYGRNIIEYNEIRNVALQTKDNGAINVWGEDPGGHVEKDVARSGYVIRYNLIADTRGWDVGEDGQFGPAVWMEKADEGSTHGIYLDNFASNCFVYGNIVVRSGCVGIYLQGGKNNIVENNIVVDTLCFSHLGGWWQPQMGSPSFMTGNRFCRNIFYRTRGNPPILYRHIGFKDEPLADAIGESDYNVLFSEADGEFTITESSCFIFPDLPHMWPKQDVIPFAKWQKEGFDTHSVIGDPLFVDAAHDDYRLKPESPALKLGFQPIDQGLIGLKGER